MFYLYDLILIRQASFGNYLQVKKGYWATATASLATLTGDELHAAAVQFKSKTGEMFFGGVDGVTSFFPDRIVEELDTRPGRWKVHAPQAVGVPPAQLLDGALKIPHR